MLKPFELSAAVHGSSSLRYAHQERRSRRENGVRTMRASRAAHHRCRLRRRAADARLRFAMGKV